MKNSRTGGASVVLFLAIVATSAITMLYLFWRFPVITAITTVILLAGLVISAVLARSIEFDSDERDHKEHSVGSH